MTDHENEAGLVATLISDIINELPLGARVSIANLEDDEFRVLELTKACHIQYRLTGISEQGNEELLLECRRLSGDNSLDDTGAAAFILKELWQRLRRTHKLRVVK